MDIRVAAYAIITDTERGLLLPHWNEGGRQGWTLPGGGIDPGEDLADAVVREVMEETGYQVDVDELLGIDSWVLSAEQRLGDRTSPLHALRIVYRAHIVGGELTVEQDGTTDGVWWFAHDEVDELDRVSLVDIGRRLAGLL